MRERDGRERMRRMKGKGKGVVYTMDACSWSKITYYLYPDSKLRHACNRFGDVQYTAFRKITLFALCEADRTKTVLACLSVCKFTLPVILLSGTQPLYPLPPDSRFLYGGVCLFLHSSTCINFHTTVTLDEGRTHTILVICLVYRCS